MWNGSCCIIYIHTFHLMYCWVTRYSNGLSNFMFTLSSDCCDLIWYLTQCITSFHTLKSLIEITVLWPLPTDVITNTSHHIILYIVTNLSSDHCRLLGYLWYLTPHIISYNTLTCCDLRSHIMLYPFSLKHYGVLQLYTCHNYNNSNLGLDCHGGTF